MTKENSLPFERLMDTSKQIYSALSAEFDPYVRMLVAEIINNKAIHNQQGGQYSLNKNDALADIDGEAEFMYLAYDYSFIIGAETAEIMALWKNKPEMYLDLVREINRCLDSCLDNSKIKEIVRENF